MENQLTCPVPNNQIPLEEFKELSNGFFFSLADKSYLNIIIVIIFITSFPIFSFLLKDGLYLGQTPANQRITCLIFSLIIPMLIITRLLLGWKYINKRLTSSTIEYEESGWQDGQKWEKPLSWITQDQLISQHEVKPVIEGLINKISFISSIIILCFVIYYIL